MKNRLFSMLSKKRSTAKSNSLRRSFIGEKLEDRRMLALLEIVPNLPIITYDNSPSQISYDPSSQLLTIHATPVRYFPTTNPLDSRPVIEPTAPPTGFDISIKVNNSGALAGGVVGDDLVISGSINVDNNNSTPAPGNPYELSGVLLTGEITAFGYQDVPSGLDLFDFRFTPTGGALASSFLGKDIGITLNTSSSFSDFSSAFSGIEVKGNVGTIARPVNIPVPTDLTTEASGPVVIGSGEKLNDTAVLSDPDLSTPSNPTGSITFYLFAPGVTPAEDPAPGENYSNYVYRNIVPVTGFGSYDTSTDYPGPTDTPGGYEPLTTGTYQWLAVYSGDANHSPSNDYEIASNGSYIPNEDEQVVVNPATPSLTTDATETSVVVGVAVLNDQATLSGGYKATEGSPTITFNLIAPDGVTVYTETQTIQVGVFTYNTTNTTQVADQVGLYYWDVSYSGNAFNNPASHSGEDDQTEQTTTIKDNPALTTDATETSVVVGVAVLNDQATLSGGYKATEGSPTITFNLIAPNGVTVYTETQTILVGVFTYNTTNTTQVADQVGLYYWDVSYSGNAFNNPASHSGEDDTSEQTKIVKPGIEIIKKTNGEDANTAAGAPVIAPGAPVTWTYEVKNTSVGWSYTTNDIVIVDDAGTPSDTSDDFSTPPSPTALTITRDASSDVGSDGILSPGETWIYSASSVAQALPSTPGSSSTIDLTMNTTTTNTTGNIRTMSAGGVSVHASAFSRTKGTNGTWAAGYLGSYSGGLGVTDTSEDGSNPGHTVDNVGRDNYVLFEFDQSVVVDQAFLGYVVNDSDLRVWIGNIPNAYSSHQTLSDSVLSGLGFTELNETTLTTTRWADFNNGNVSGNILVIAASPDDTTPEDNFKIKKLTIGQPGTPGCYENYAQVTTPFDDVTATDLSHYCNPPAQTPLPKIDIEKTTTGSPNANSTAPTYDNEDTPNGAGVPILTPGSTVTWTYQVTNTGNVPFAKADVVVKDDNGTASTGDDFTPVYVSGDVLPNGSVGIDNILSPGEVWIYQASGTVKTLSSATGSSATFDFSGSSYTDGTDGNVRSYSASGVAVKASAWSRVKGPEISTSWAPAYLGAYGGGLGVTDSSEGDGSSNLHTVDNVGRDNYVLFEFDQMVAIDSAFLGYVVDDSDLRVWIGTKTNPYSNHQSLNDAFLASMGFTEDNLTDLTTTRLADLNSGNFVGNVVIIAANPGDDTPEDRFKIEKITVKPAEAGVYVNKGMVTVPGASDSDLSHYKNPIAPPPPPTTGSISGYVYKECDNDGCRESGESGLKDVTVKLYDSAGALVATAKTASDGSYKFANLPAGTYKLVETQPTAYFDGKEKAGSLGGNTSVNDQISNIMLTAGTNAYDYNFAELYGGSLSGYVYKDSDNDGRKDYGEGGIQGVKILLTGTDILGRAVSRYVYTDCNGYYLFDNLYAGTYTISEVDPSYYADGKDTLGNLGGCLLNDKFTNIKVGFCDVGLNYNFGERSSSGC